MQKKLHGWAMSWKCLVNGFQWAEVLNEDFINDYDEDSDEGYFLEGDVEYPKNLFSLLNDLSFLPEWNKIKKLLVITSNKLTCNVHDKEDYVVHIRALKQALNHGLKLKKVHKVIKFNQKA